MTQEREEEQELWQKVVRGTRENPQRNRAKKEKQAAKEKHEEEAEEEEDEGTKEAGTKEAGTKEDRAKEDKSSAMPSGVREEEKLRHGGGRGLDRRSARRLRRGEMAIEDRLDLHGLSRDQAREVLLAGLRRCYDRGFRCVLVISGKGRGILREQVLSMLDGVEVRDIVVEHYEARVRDGGEGARYVLLRRKRG